MRGRLACSRVQQVEVQEEVRGRAKFTVETRCGLCQPKSDKNSPRGQQWLLSSQFVLTSAMLTPPNLSGLARRGRINYKHTLQKLKGRANGVEPETRVIEKTKLLVGAGRVSNRFSFAPPAGSCSSRFGCTTSKRRRLVVCQRGGVPRLGPGRGARTFGHGAWRGMVTRNLHNHVHVAACQSEAALAAGKL